jgi:hypothetical protein
MRKFAFTDVQTAGAAAEARGAVEPAKHQPLTGPEIGNVKRAIVSACAELAWRYKRKLHACGFFPFDLPRGAQLPLWAEMCFHEFRQHGWQVQELRGAKGGKRYLVRWPGWMKHARRRRK